MNFLHSSILGRLLGVACWLVLLPAALRADTYTWTNPSPPGSVNFNVVRTGSNSVAITRIAGGSSSAVWLKVNASTDGGANYDSAQTNLVEGTTSSNYTTPCIIRLIATDHIDFGSTGFDSDPCYLVFPDLSHPPAQFTGTTAYNKLGKIEYDRLRKGARVGGAIDLATGAEQTSRPLFSFSGARNWEFALTYDSVLAGGQTGQGAFGKGWTHDFESSVEVSGSDLVLHWDATRANVFSPVSGQTGVYSSTEDGARYDTITAQSGGGWLLVRRNQSSRLFNAGGQLVEDRDASGRKLVLTYTSGKLMQITDSVSSTSITFAYDTSGTVSTLTDATFAAVTCGYTGTTIRNLTSITNQNGKTTTFGYSGVLTTLTDHTGAVLTNNTYDNYGRVMSQATYPSGIGFNYAEVSSYVPYTASGVTRPPPPDTGNSPVIYTTVTGSENPGQYVFDANFNLLSVTRFGSTTSYTYDSANRVTSITDPLGHVTQFTYDANGNILTITDAAGKVTTFTYDARHNLLTATDPLAHTTTGTYDANNNLLTITDALGRTTTLTYNGDSLPLTITLPRGGVYTFAYTAGRVTQITDPNGVIVKFGYDANGRVLYREDALGKRTTMTYDGVGNVLTTTNALNQTYTYAYDHRNRLTSVTDPAGSVTGATYDPNHNLKTLTNALGKTATFVYDDRNRLLQALDALGGSARFNYDDFARVVLVYDRATSPTTRLEYDAAGQTTAVQDAGNARTVATYDARGLPLTVTDPLNRTTTYTYDDAVRTVTAKDPLNRTTTFGYDALDRMNQVTDPGSLVTSQGYDTDGNRTSFTNAAGQSTAFTVDVGGRVAAIATPEGRNTTITYNSRGLPDTITEPSTQATTFAYDDAARPASVTDGVGTIAFTRDSVGRVLTVTENGKTLTRIYDALGRVTSYTDGDGNTIGYGYDDLNRLATLTYPDNKQVTYGYDTTGRLKTVTDWANRVTTYSHDPLGRLTQTVRPNGTKQTRTYDLTGRVLQLCEFAPDGVTVIYSSDHTYDAAEQLIKEVLFPQTPALASDVTQTFDHDNRLLTHKGAAATFDADGNLLSIASGPSPATYTYDARNRLTSAGGLTYTYDAENRRVAVTDTNGTTRFAINPNASLDQVLVRTASDGTKTFYVYGVGLAYEQTGSTVRYYHHDRRGDTVALTDGTGAVTDRASYGVYGEIVSRAGTTNTPFLFNGLYGVQTDANGLYCLRARYYHPALLRFLNQDTVLGTILSTAGMNRYAYANGNPVSLIDPFGTAAQDVSPNSWWRDFFRGFAAAPALPLYLIGKFFEPINYAGRQVADWVQDRNREFGYPLPPEGLDGGMNAFAFFLPGMLGKFGGMLGKFGLFGKEAEVVAAGTTTAMRAGQVFETDVLAAQNLPKNTGVWRPTVAQIDSAAFKVIVGDARYTSTGLARGTIMDSVQGGFLEIKGGSSVLDFTYQLRLQIYRSLIESTPYTIQTTRPVSIEFGLWLSRWGGRIEAPPGVP